MNEWKRIESSYSIILIFTPSLSLLLPPSLPDSRFVEHVFNRILKKPSSEYLYLNPTILAIPFLTLDQFFSVGGFADRKVSFLLEVVRLVRRAQKELKLEVKRQTEVARREINRGKLGQQNGNFRGGQNKNMDTNNSNGNTVTNFQDSDFNLLHLDHHHLNDHSQSAQSFGLLSDLNGLSQTIGSTFTNSPGPTSPNTVNVSVLEQHHLNQQSPQSSQSMTNRPLADILLNHNNTQNRNRSRSRSGNWRDRLGSQNGIIQPQQQQLQQQSTVSNNSKNNSVTQQQTMHSISIKNDSKDTTTDLANYGTTQADQQNSLTTALLALAGPLSSLAKQLNSQQQKSENNDSQIYPAPGDDDSNSLVVKDQQQYQNSQQQKSLKTLTQMDTVAESNSNSHNQQQTVNNTSNANLLLSQNQSQIQDHNSTLNTNSLSINTCQEIQTQSQAVPSESRVNKFSSSVEEARLQLGRVESIIKKALNKEKSSSFSESVESELETPKESTPVEHPMPGGQQYSFFKTQQTQKTSKKKQSSISKEQQQFFQEYQTVIESCFERVCDEIRVINKKMDSMDSRIKKIETAPGVDMANVNTVSSQQKTLVSNAKSDTGNSLRFSNQTSMSSLSSHPKQSTKTKTNSPLILKNVVKLQDSLISPPSPIGVRVLSPSPVKYFDTDVINNHKSTASRIAEAINVSSNIMLKSSNNGINTNSTIGGTITGTHSPKMSSTNTTRVVGVNILKSPLSNSISQQMSPKSLSISQSQSELPYQSNSKCFIKVQPRLSQTAAAVTGQGSDSNQSSEVKLHNLSLTTPMASPDPQSQNQSQIRVTSNPTVSFVAPTMLRPRVGSLVTTQNQAVNNVTVQESDQQKNENENDSNFNQDHESQVSTRLSPKSNTMTNMTSEMEFQSDAVTNTNRNTSNLNFGQQSPMAPKLLELAPEVNNHGQISTKKLLEDLSEKHKKTQELLLKAKKEKIVDN